MRRLVVCLAVLAAASLGAPAAESAPTVTGGPFDYVTQVPLIPDEAKSDFLSAPEPLTLAAGTVKFTVRNPKSATGMHGIAIDGGDYNDVEGAAVGPGNYSALTISLKPGEYTVYDPAGDNRAKGYVVKVKVSGKPERAPGAFCERGRGFIGTGRVYVKKMSCRFSKKLAPVLAKRWARNDYMPLFTRFRGFSCRIDSFNRHGERAACRNGAKRISFR